MSPPTPSIVDLGDTQHPNFHLSVKNQSSMLLGKIPREVRHMIYEFAVCEDKPIRPLQMTRHSNKFVWGSWKFVNGVINNTYRSCRIPIVPQMTVVPLARTCRAVYAELDALSVFYRVNDFHFCTVKEICIFLASITRRRREGIRSINLANDLSSTTGVRTDKRMLALLSQCDIRQFSMTLNFIAFSLAAGPLVFDAARETVDALTTYLLTLRESNASTPSILSLPCLRLNLAFEDCTIRLGTPDPFPASASLPPPGSEASASEINQDDIERRERVMKETGGQRPQWFDEMCDDDLIRRITASLRIDFPGEDRVTLDRFNSNIGAISSRTRQKCQPPNNSQGVLSRQSSKYGADGRVVWSIRKVTRIRWSGDGEVECESVWAGDSPTSWESLHSLMNCLSERHIRHFFLEQLSSDLKRTDVSPGQLLEERSAQPSPRDIITISGPIWEVMRGEANESRITTIKRQWDKLQKTWNERMTELGETRDREGMGTETESANDATRRGARPKAKPQRSQRIGARIRRARRRIVLDDEE
ncbi:hypothetical protein AAE478_008662 [Parahypoxylon ruwenzoriense]